MNLQIRLEDRGSVVSGEIDASNLLASLRATRHERSPEVHFPAVAEELFPRKLRALCDGVDLVDLLDVGVD